MGGPKRRWLTQKLFLSIAHIGALSYLSSQHPSHHAKHLVIRVIQQPQYLGLATTRKALLVSSDYALSLSLRTVPIVGRVAAGQPILAEENIIGEVLVDSRAARHGRCFALEVQGDSMIDASIDDGDLVVVRQQPLAESGDIVVALLDQEATVKRLFVRDERIELRPENPKLRPMPIGPDDGLRILGKVIAVSRSGSHPSNAEASARSFRSI